MSHTILLVQPVANKASRTYSDFETVPQAMDGVLALFEKRLKELNPQMRQITYDINDLYRYIDTLQDLSALVFASGAWSSCATQPTGRWRRGSPLVAPPIAASARVSSGCDVMNPCSEHTAARARPVRGCKLPQTTDSGCARDPDTRWLFLHRERRQRSVHAPREGLDQAAVLHPPEEASRRQMRDGCCVAPRL